MVQDDPDREIKLQFINRQKRLFDSVLIMMEDANKRGAISESTIQEFKNNYNQFVYDEAKKAYTEYKLKHIKKKNYYDDLFSAEV